MFLFCLQGPDSIAEEGGRKLEEPDPDAGSHNRRGESFSGDIDIKHVPLESDAECYVSRSSFNFMSNNL